LSCFAEFDVLALTVQMMFREMSLFSMSSATRLIFQRGAVFGFALLICGCDKGPQAEFKLRGSTKDLIPDAQRAVKNTLSDGFGTPNNPAVVYASGKMVNGVMVENDLKFSGQENGYGILVVEIDDPNKAQFNMSGQSMWHGLIIVAINKVPTSNKQPLSFVGGGNAIHVIGGVFVYDRNIKRTATETATLLGVEMVKLAGNGNITFSDQAIDQNFKMRPTSMQVRSWRRLSESE